MSVQPNTAARHVASAESPLSLWLQLEALTGRINQRLDRIASDFGLPLSEFFTLRALVADGARGARLHDIAYGVGINASTMSRIATRLQGRGLVQRVTCDVDGRGVYCAITPAGRQLADDIEGVIEPELTQLLGGASLEVDTAAIVGRLLYTPR